jgi:hypothetical protein
LLFVFFIVPQDPITTENQIMQQTLHRDPFKNWAGQTEAHPLEDSHLRVIPRDEALELAITNNRRPSPTIQVITSGLFAVWLLGCIAGITGIISVTIPRYAISLSGVGTRGDTSLYIVTSVLGGLYLMPLAAMMLKYYYCMLCLPDMTLKRIFIYMVQRDK